MSTKEKVIVSAAFVILTLVGLLNLASKKEVNAPITGAIDRANVYQGTTTDSTWNAQALVTGGSRLLACGTPASLGTIIITNETAGSFTIYDATTTRNGAIYGTTTLAKVYPSQAEGTYVYDIGVRYGILVEHQSSNVASSTITFRGNPVCQ